jgi:hypothetical protein
MIKIDFEKTDPTGTYTYRDALYLPDDNTYTESEIETMKQDRFNTWYQIVTTPQPVDDTPIPDPSTTGV